MQVSFNQNVNFNGGTVKARKGLLAAIRKAKAIMTPAAEIDQACFSTNRVSRPKEEIHESLMSYGIKSLANAIIPGLR